MGIYLSVYLLARSTGYDVYQSSAKHATIMPFV